MQKLTSLKLKNFAGNTGLVKLGLVILAGLIINVGRAAPPVNDKFANASPLIINKFVGLHQWRQYFSHAAVRCR